MKMRCKRRAILAAILTIAAAATFNVVQDANASDHDEAPLVKTDASVDLTDLYIFKTGENETTAIACWGGFNDSRPQPDSEALYNSNVLYTMNIDNNEDNVADILLRWRFGQNSTGAWGVQAENVPGSSGTISGPVETILSGGGETRIWSGHADEPFFFDVQGYLDTLATGTLSIRNTTSVLSGLNVTCFAAEMETSAMRVEDKPLQFWLTAARK